MKPSLSVLMPNYNDSQTLTQALDAICGQSFLPKEIVIVDDCSTDNSVEIIEGAARRYPIIRLMRNSKNLGCVPSVNVALKECSGDYVYGASANDLILPGFFEKSMKMLEENPQAPLCCGNSQFFNTNTGEIEPFNIHWSDKPSYINPTQMKTVIKEHGLFFGITAIWKRQDVLSVGGFRPELYWCNDFFPYCVLVLRKGACYVPETFGTVRLESRDSWKQDRPKTQKKINQLLIELVKSTEFKDIAQSFVQTGLLMLPDQMEEFLVDNPQHWDLISSDTTLLKQIVNKRLNKGWRHFTPEMLSGLYVYFKQMMLNRSTSSA